MAEGVEAPRAKQALLEMTTEVRAAGGVVRRRVDGHVLTVLVHRPRYDDWTFPKGKLLEGESFEDAALREVLEETGLECRIDGELSPLRYTDQDGRPKVVRYWSMDVLDSGNLHPTDEVDEARWFTLAEARTMLSYDRDREVLDPLTTHDAPAFLVRHAKAGDRATWTGDDLSRPLSKTGSRQAKALVRVLSSRAIERILSSPAIRCVETVRPLADQRGLPIEPRDELFEAAPLSGLLGLLDELRSTSSVLCGHGDLIPAVVEHLEAQGAVVGSDRGWKKASVWVLEREAGLIVRATYVPPPEVKPKASARSREPVGKRRRA
jgi:phosphohistidine phosphatase SixA/8-oxo-dGTP pyrophosphatase MutT (NUDIX family)